MINDTTVRSVLEACWSRQTSSLWSIENPAKGQCGVTALVVNDHFGGEILKTRVGGAWHYYNRIGGIRYDLTACQFTEVIVYQDIASGRNEAFSDTNSAQYVELSTRFGSRSGHRDQSDPGGNSLADNAVM